MSREAKSAGSSTKSDVAENAEDAITVLSLADVAEEERDLLAGLCASYREESEKERTAKKTKDALMEEIRPIAEKLGVERKRMKIAASADGESGAPPWELVQRARSWTEIDAKRLLAKGVSMDVILYATMKRETPYYTVVAGGKQK